MGYSPWNRKRVGHDLATKPPQGIGRTTKKKTCILLSLWHKSSDVIRSVSKLSILFQSLSTHIITVLVMVSLDTWYNLLQDCLDHLSFMYFHINQNHQFPRHKICKNFGGITSNLQIILGKMDVCQIQSPSIHKYGVFLHLCQSYLFQQQYQFPVTSTLLIFFFLF